MEPTPEEIQEQYPAQIKVIIANAIAEEVPAICDIAANAICKYIARERKEKQAAEKDVLFAEQEALLMRIGEQHATDAERMGRLHFTRFNTEGSDYADFN